MTGPTATTLTVPLTQGVIVADLVDRLLANPGTYVGPQADPNDTSSPPSVARIVVSPLPGNSGVMFDYEVLDADGSRPHLEHSILARATGGLVLVTSHTHADVLTVIEETEPGYFEAADGTSPFPIAIRLEVPEDGHLVYSWSYGWAQEPLRVRDIGDVRLLR
jgi:hypothetical protein